MFCIVGDLAEYIRLVSSRMLACKGCIGNIHEDWVCSFRRISDKKLRALTQHIRGKLSMDDYFELIVVDVMRTSFEFFVFLLFCFSVDVSELSILLLIYNKERNVILMCEFKAKRAVDEAQQISAGVESETSMIVLETKSKCEYNAAKERSNEVVERQKQELQGDCDRLDAEIAHQRQRNQEAADSMNMMMLMLGVSAGVSGCFGNGDAFLRCLSANNIVQDSCLDGSGRNFNDYTGPPEKSTDIEDLLSRYEKASKLGKNLNKIYQDLKICENKGGGTFPVQIGGGGASDCEYVLKKSFGESKLKRGGSDTQEGYKGNTHGLLEQEILTVDLGKDVDYNEKGYVIGSSSPDDYGKLFSELNFSELSTSTLDDIIPKLEHALILREVDAQRFVKSPNELAKMNKVKTTAYYTAQDNHAKIMDHIRVAIVNADNALAQANPSQDGMKDGNLAVVQEKTLSERKLKSEDTSFEASAVFKQNTELLEKKVNENKNNSSSQP